jgi:hydrogenase maturation factor HypF (carbamoyltransferase family)
MADLYSDVPPAVPWNLVDKQLKALEEFAPRLKFIGVMLRIVWPIPLLLEDQESIYRRLVETSEELATLSQYAGRNTQEEWSRALRRMVRFVLLQYFAIV